MKPRAFDPNVIIYLPRKIVNFSKPLPQNFTT